ncbi:MAG: DUF1722 domain-containing protein, partial [Bdellovibrionales bacterium]|nr:DUF1722 domain-containing protein [Bdellovibrionales bacterium]
YEFILNEHTENKLGTIIQNTNRDNVSIIYQNYFSSFIKAIKQPPTKRNRVKSFKIIYIQIKEKLTYLDKKYFKYIINSYRSGKISYINIISELQFMDNKYKLEIDKTYLFCPFPYDLSNS